MEKKSFTFLEKLMKTPTPCGYEDKGRKLWRAEVKPHADKVYGDVHGNSIGVIKGKETPRIMLAGHIDEIGFQVKYGCKT